MVAAKDQFACSDSRAHLQSDAVVIVRKPAGLDARLHLESRFGARLHFLVSRFLRCVRTPRDCSGGASGDEAENSGFPGIRAPAEYDQAADLGNDFVDPAASHRCESQFSTLEKVISHTVNQDR